MYTFSLFYLEFHSVKRLHFSLRAEGVIPKSEALCIPGPQTWESFLYLSETIGTYLTCGTFSTMCLALWLLWNQHIFIPHFFLFCHPFSSLPLRFFLLSSHFSVPPYVCISVYNFHFLLVKAFG